MSEIYAESDRPKLVYICSPYKGNVRRNTAIARRICRSVVIDSGGQFVPVAPHLLYTQFLNDNDEKERKLGLRAGKNLLRQCDELWAYIPDSGPTEGMKAEIATARSLGIKVTEFSLKTEKGKKIVVNRG